MKSKIKLNITMELIHIIYNILLFGGGFVIVLMVFSFVLSKSRQQENLNNRLATREASEQLIRSRVNYLNQVASVVPRSKLQWEQNEIRQNTIQPIPKIFSIDQIQPREVKVVRKPTVREEQKTIVTEERNTNSKRYTIVNENQRKTNSRVINFYL